ncbi:hypothetical protein AGLY_014686 [Aphis glycines]|uniref:Uncharacterized protein n=1 Tax=Aphis glycines TaxID=307491 RepID=A0A6G0T1X1_APHGL|nr:hypothetical protein AGLY_014686 [Aphis glycines]
MFLFISKHLNFKFLRNRVTITIYPQTVLNICYHSKIYRFFKAIRDSKIIRIHIDNFCLLAFGVQILTKIRQNHEYLQIIFYLCLNTLSAIVNDPPQNVYIESTTNQLLLSTYMRYDNGWLTRYSLLNKVNFSGESLNFSIYGKRSSTIPFLIHQSEYTPISTLGNDAFCTNFRLIFGIEFRIKH